MDKQFLEGIKGIAYSSTDESSFSVDEWGLYDWSMMLSNYPKLETLSELAQTVGVDARETFFALSGYEISGDGPKAAAWGALLDTPAWKKAIGKAKTQLDKAALLTKMLQQMGRRKMDKDESQEQDAEELDIPDLDLDNLEQIEISPDDDIPTNEEIEDAEAMMLLVQFMTPGFEGEKQDILEQAQTLASMIDMGTFKDLIGFTNRIVKGASRKAETPRGEMVGYGRDSWSDQVISTDMAAVARGELSAMVKLVEGGLTTRKFQGETVEGKGPCVLLRDVTGSMTYSNLHAPAMSLEIALADGFNKDGRDLVSVLWGGDRDGSSHTSEYTYGEPGMEQHLRTNFRSSYTYLYDALTEGLDITEKYVPGADILILTDGVLGDSDRLGSCRKLGAKLERFWGDGGRIWVIVLGELDPESWDESLPIADGIIQMDDVSAGEGLEKIIASMADRSDASSLQKRYVG